MNDMFGREIKLGDLVLYLFTSQSSGINKSYYGVVGFTKKMVVVSEKKKNHSWSREQSEKLMAHNCIVCNELWDAGEVEYCRETLEKCGVEMNRENQQTRPTHLVSNRVVLDDTNLEDI